MNQALKTQPGVYFETVLPRPRQALPRMDIAAFVGFAQKGPLHTPVPIEDKARFREIFGEDLALAWDRDQGDYERSYLGSAVSTFFKNGGRRCWVVRVANEEQAVSHRFQLPGLLGIHAAAIEAMETHVVARSPGSWARLLRVGAALDVTQIYAEGVGGEDLLKLASGGWTAQAVSLPQELYPGDLLEVSVDGIDDRLFLVVKAIDSETNPGVRLSGDTGYWVVRNAPASPPAENIEQRYSIFPLARTADLGHPTSWPSGIAGNERPRIRLLRFGMHAWANGVLRHRLPDLAFHPDHPRFWGNLPDDQQLFANPEGKRVDTAQPQTEQLIVQAGEPRFPLAGMIESANPGFELARALFLPVEMGYAPDIEGTREPGPGYGDSLARQDGLETFDAAYFLDDELLHYGSSSLLREAEHRAFLQQRPRILKGIHSLVANDEVTLISTPDAIHRRWDRIPPDPVAGLAAPVLNKIILAKGEPKLTLEWIPVAGATSYWLQRDASPEFSNPVQVELRGDPLEAVGETPEQLPIPPTSRDVILPPVCPANVYFRVRTERLGEVSPWSNSRARLVPESAFEDCDLIQPQLLEIALASPEAGSLPDTHNLAWGPAAESGLGSPPGMPLLSSPPAGHSFVIAERYLLQVATDMEFASIVESFELSSDTCSYKNSSEALLYLRVRAFRQKTAGPWSNTVFIEPTTLKQLTLQQLQRFSDVDVTGIHRALLRLCAARADLFAVLTLPRHYQAQQALDHVAGLRPFGLRPITGAAGLRVQPLSRGEAHALSYAALYHPWIAVSVTDELGSGELSRSIPADGVVLGSMARVAADHGAWIAPANDLFTDIVALDQVLSPIEKARLISTRINLLEQDARGFLLMSSNTLSEREDYRLINVRRLMILIRRLALVEGQQFVFEPNSGSFRDLVQDQFEGFMFDMYARGAFSGATPQQAFRVVTDGSVNTERRSDRGQFVIELQVAPSRPMTFLTVRLLQSGLNELFVQEL